MKQRSLFFILLSLGSSVHAQQTAKQKDSIAKNIIAVENKAIVFIIRPTDFGGPIDMEVHCNDLYVGTTHAKTYLYAVIDPGNYTFLSQAENKSQLELTMEPGKIYYIEQSVKYGFAFARAKLKLVTEEVGKKLLAKCKLSEHNNYTE